MVAEGEALEGHHRVTPPLKNQPDPTKAGEGPGLRSGKEVPFSFKELCKNSIIYKHRACYCSGVGTLLTFVECSIHGHRQLHNVVHTLGVFHLFCGQALQLLLHQETEDLVRVLRASAVPLRKEKLKDRCNNRMTEKTTCSNSDVTQHVAEEDSLLYPVPPKRQQRGN